ncbi:PAS domain S-box protein [Rhodoferax sp. U2-2l]|uniref:PAS domain-containing sensor histidine kinase n=1 Tax=Rhodoferax sp. U2-2l TaxID=2884000 RepID=UPI001D09E134|nr:PAS domain-containing sensor histidine kinase [Rhodoferax sp. U2-2l]MCB8745744.1 PAS domain S-box protein [Rhodoferax sp. U2-2l]
MGTQRRTNSQPPQPDVDLTGEAPGGLCLSDGRLLVVGKALQFGIWDWNLATGELDWTAELDAIYGLKPGTFGRTYSDFSKRVHPQDLGQVERVRDDALAAGRPFHVEFRIIRPDGDIRWVRSAGDALRDTAGRVTRAIGTTIDITDQKHLQLALSTNEARLQTALKLTDLVIWHQDARLRYTWVANPALGFTHEFLIGRRDEDIFDQEDARQLGLIKRRVMLTGRGERQEVWATSLGRTGCFDLIVEPERAADGRITGLICAAADITSRKRAEEHLQLQADILHNLQEGVNIVDSHGILHYTNPKFDAMFGYAAGELVGQSAAILNAPGTSDPDETAQAILRTLALDGHWSGNLQSRRKDGSVFWSNVNIVATQHPKFGKAWISLQSDITVLRQARLERDMAHRAIGHLADHVQDKMEEQRREISREVHDQIGAALTGIRMQLVALSQAPAPANVAPVLADIDKVLATTRVLCSDLRPPILDDLGLAETLRWYVRDWAKKSGIRASTRIAALGMEPADPLRIDIFRILQELLTNVTRHAGARRVNISLSHAAGQIRLQVADDGHGFQPGQTGGFGLLGIRERLRRHGGELRIQSTPAGTRVTVSAPETGS